MRAKNALSWDRGFFALRAKLPTGKLALVLLGLGILSPCLIAHPAKTRIASAQRITPPGEPTIKARKLKESGEKTLKTRHKKKRKFRRSQRLKKQREEERRRREELKKKAEKPQPKKPLEPSTIGFRWSLGLTYNQVETSGDHHRNSTVEPSVHSELAWAITPIATETGGGSLFFGLQLANFTGATIYDDLFFRYSYTYLGPSLSYRYFLAGDKVVAPTGGVGQGLNQPLSQKALTWSFAVKAAVMMVLPSQQGQSNADKSEFEFKGKRGLQFDSPGLLAEAGASYHLNNAFACDLAVGTMLATERTYTFVLLGVSNAL